MEFMSFLFGMCVAYVLHIFIADSTEHLDCRDRTGEKH